MKKHLTLIALLGALFATAGFAQAQSSTDAKPAAKKKLTKKAPAKKAAAAAAAAPAAKMPFSSDAEDDDSEPELGGTLSADKHIAIRWNKRIHRLTRVATTTGANRFENHKMGLVWIGIPAKGLLLDSKKGQQLANECKNAEQLQAAATAGAPAVAAAQHN